MIGHSLKNMFDSFGFAYDFAFSQNNGSLKNFRNVFWKNLWKILIDTIFSGGIPTNKWTNRVRWVQNRKFSKFQKVEIWKILFFKDNSIFSCVVESFVVRIGRSPGPDFDKMFEVPEIIQKVLEYDREP